MSIGRQSTHSKEEYDRITQAREALAVDLTGIPDVNVLIRFGLYPLTRVNTDNLDLVPVQVISQLGNWTVCGVTTDVVHENPFMAGCPNPVPYFIIKE